MNIHYNSYGEIRNKTEYKYLEDLFYKIDNSNEEKEILKNKVRCYCGLILLKNTLKSHISTSKLHRDRMRKFNLSDYNYYVNPIKPYSRIDKCITITNEKIVLNFD
jgi:hypothetical protein